MTAPEVTPVIDAWAVAQRQFDIAADRLSLDPELRAVLREAGAPEVLGDLSETAEVLRLLTGGFSLL